MAGFLNAQNLCRGQNRTIIFRNWPTFSSQPLKNSRVLETRSRVSSPPPIDQFEQLPRIQQDASCRAARRLQKASAISETSETPRHCADVTSSRAVSCSSRATAEAAGDSRFDAME